MVEMESWIDHSWNKKETQCYFHVHTHTWNELACNSHGCSQQMEKSNNGFSIDFFWTCEVYFIRWVFKNKTYLVTIEEYIAKI